MKDFKHSVFSGLTGGMQKAYRYRLYPTDEQGGQITRIIGCRFVWNRLLEYCSKSCKRRHESHNSFDLSNFICHARHDRDRNSALNLKSYGMNALAGDVGEVKPPEMPSVDESRVCSCRRSMASVNEEKRPGYPFFLTLECRDSSTEPMVYLTKPTVG